MDDMEMNEDLELDGPQKKDLDGDEEGLDLDGDDLDLDDDTDGAEDDM